MPETIAVDLIVAVLVNPQFRPSGSRIERAQVQFPGNFVSESGRRYYQPSLGRWLGRDPIEEKGGLHLYGFVGNNGVNRWDVLGMGWVTRYRVDPNDPNESQEAYLVWVDDPFIVAEDRIDDSGEREIQIDAYNASRFPTTDTSTAPSSYGSSVPDATNSSPTRWSDEDCGNVSTLISYYNDSLADFRKTHHGSYIEDRNLAANQANADFQGLYGTTIADYITNSIGWAGVVTYLGGLAADASGRAALIEAGFAIDTIVNGFSHPAGAGLGSSDLNAGNTGSAVSNFAGAGGNIVSLLINGAKAAGTASRVIPIWGQVLSASSAAIFTVDYFTTAQIKRNAAREITESYAKLEKMEEGFSEKLKGLQSDWDKHCK